MIDVQALKAQQRQLAQRLILQESFAHPVRWIGGGDVGFMAGGALTRGVITVLSFPALQLVEQQIAIVPTTMPYRTGLLAFREYPALLAAWQQLTCFPDLLLVDGQGIAHPQRLGLASHFGLLQDVPTIGVAKSRLCGQYQPLSAEVDACQALWHESRQLGWVWRSKARCHPLFISPGHKMSVDGALAWVRRCMAGYRLPEPTRLADAIASRRRGEDRLI